MSRNNIYEKKSTWRRMALCGLLFLCFAGSVMAQSNAPLYVIKYMDGLTPHYLSHTGSGPSAAIVDATTFSPNCLWYSGPNVEYNYYFIDEAGNYRYLSAPLELNGELYLTPTHPGTVVLNMASSGQYFYDWDHGVARGEEITGLTSEQCTSSYNGYDPIKDECWKVVWVSYEEYQGNMRWQMSSEYGYNPTTYAARYKSVAKTEHPVEILVTPVPTGGLPTIADFAMTYSADPLATHALDGMATPFSCTYRPAYTTYVFEGGTHNYYNNTDNGTNIPGTSTLSGATPVSYSWTLTGEGAQYLSLSADDVPDPTLTYHTENTTTSHKMATLTLTATYEGDVKQVRTVTVTVKAQCQNPIQASAPVVTYDNVTLSWVPTAEQYRLQWQASGGDWSAVTEVTGITADSYTFTGSDFTALGYGQSYDYRVSAYCSSGYLDYPDEQSGLIYHFTTFAEPGLFIFGSVYGGGRMANVNGSTEVVVIDCDSVNAVYGGNDIAGIVSGSSTITLGANASDANATAYNNGNASTKVRVFDVYGGGNGYYAYNGTSFTAASSEYYEQEVDVNGVVRVMTQTNQVGEVVWTNTGTSAVTLEFPKIASATITVTNDQVKVDSLFGGAKNAFITTESGNGSAITFNGGTAYAVFGGNNIGGGQGHGKHHIDVVNTKTNLTTTTGFGRSFGIGYLFGGGNKVYGSTTEIFITGGQCDTVFAGGNAASVYAANVTMNCPMSTGSGSTFGSVYTNAITGFTAGTPPTLTMNDGYTWDGTGVYNVRTLFGGNNRAMMTCLPTVTLTSGSVGTVYGGGNAGNMMAQTTGGLIHFDTGLDLYDFSFDYSTKVVMNSATMLVDNLYGGCQMSDVGYSTWVQVQDGHVGTVYGGCNISGDVGSTRVHLDADPNNTDGHYQEVYGTTNVEVSGGTVHKDVFAGSNGFYHCVDAYGISYVEGITYDPAGHSYVGMKVPTHNETHVVISGTAVINNNVYAGGNMAPVGFTSIYISYTPYAYPRLVGLASVRMIGGTVKGSVYGGGRMASISGNNEVRVTGGSIGYDGDTPTGGALYGGNDRLGKAGGMSNRVLPDIYNTASDHITPLLSGSPNERVNTYVGVSGSPTINTVYGGGNGAYTYTGPGADMQYCDASDLPIQSNVFVDIAIDGNAGANGTGYIANVFGGGNGVRAQGFVKVFLNVKNQSGDTQAHVGTIYGGNNMGDMENVVPEIILLKGNVQTVYGGCNSGAMAAVDGNTKSFTIGGTPYNNIGSYVRLLSSYDGDGEGGSEPVTPTAVVKDAVYGGCRMNGVTSNSMVIVEGGNHSTANIFGGSDISGDVSGTSYVVVNGSYDVGTSTYNGVVNDVFGGGNGNYTYDSGPYDGLTPPYCRDSRVIMLDGQVANLYAGGYAGECGETTMTVDGGLVTGSVFGGGNEAGSTTSYDLTTTTFDGNHVSHTSTTTVTTTGNSSVIVNGGSVNSGVYGGCNTRGNIAGDIEVDVLDGTIGVSTSSRANVHGGGYGAATETSGDVTVNIGATNGAVPPTYSGTAIIYGDIYGGSALGEVSASDKLTQVNFYKGTVNGDVYGGGLGNNDYAAEVSGDVEVNIYGGVFNSSTGTADGGSIYGCNNVNGKPLGNVEVHIYATDHDYYPTTPPSPYPSWTLDALAANAESQDYAIKAVYGGGNLAAYTPTETKSTTVHVHGCSNTIETVFGGGNAADVGVDEGVNANTNVIIDGGRIQRVIGGGNGQTSAANIYGTATTTVKAGLIDEIFGGANISGTINTINLNVLHEEGDCTTEVFGKVFGCANEAPYNHSITTTIGCGVGDIGELYGGSNKAHIGVNDGSNSATVTLNVYGGHYNKVFAGSKGVSGGTDAPIYGNVNLNLYGGTMVDAFGGSDQNGNITGRIIVNVLDYEGDCGLDVTNIYGASNQTAYAPTNTTLVSPIVNVMHIKQNDGIKGDVFGGGNLAAVTACPQVNIGYVADAVLYDETLMSSQIPTGYTISNLRAYVTGNVFGGGNNISGASRGVTGNPVINMRNGTVHTDIYGGCNQDGVVTGAIAVNLTGGTVENDVFGGGKGNATETDGNITVTVEGSTVGRDVYGGSAFGQVNSGSSQLTKTWLKSGTITGNLYGGGMGEDGHDTYGQVNGQVEVYVNGGSVDNVFGCNNTNGQPTSTVKVYINETTPGGMDIGGNVYGGGNVAYYDGTPDVYIQNGTINNMVFGGGNNITIDNKGVGGSNVLMTGGTVLGGIYGGCNTKGYVVGNSVVTINGGTIGASSYQTTNIHGGGYGHLTKVKGNVTVTFGVDGAQNDYPILYGGLYGGSALGDVNDGNTKTTTVTVYNGTIVGSVFGGGLGEVGIPAKVYGKVYVKIGKMIAPVAPATEPTFSGEATLHNCDIYGCNNVNGSPQDEVYVDVYSTHREPKEMVGYSGLDAEYAIQNVFGGGNRAHYAPDGPHKTHVYVHGCDNTSEFLYAGGNAADAYGVEIVVEGGRFWEAYGGGNGLLVPANIGAGGIVMNFHGGHYSYTYTESNKWGTVSGTINFNPGWPPDGVPAGEYVDCGGAFVESHFFGANQAEIYVDVLENTITCEEAALFHYTNVYAGSRWAIIYGDVKLTVGGGEIMNLFGGSQGYEQFSADIRKYPTAEEIAADVAIPHKYSDELRAYMQAHPERAGQGGNVTLVVNGGTIGNVIGGCNVNGNVEGEINVIIADAGNGTCPLSVGNVYGASNRAFYEPKSTTAPTPQVEILKGTLGMEHTFNGNSLSFAGHVYGGGNEGHVTSNPMVIVGDGTTGASATPVTIKGDVYGGGNLGTINGSAEVVVVPQPAHSLSIGAVSNGSVEIAHLPTIQSTPATIGEGVKLSVKAIPNEGYAFNGWACTGTDASISHSYRASTTFTMGTGDATITPSFIVAPVLTITPPDHGTIEVTNSQGVAVSTNSYVGQGTVLNIVATPDEANSSGGYVFSGWTASSGTLGNASLASTTFTMGNSPATLSASFTSTANVHTLTVLSTPDGAGTFLVNNKDYSSPVYVAENVPVTVLANAATGYLFTGWTASSGTLGNASLASTTFTMGSADATLTANFTAVPTLTMTLNPSDKGRVRVNGTVYIDEVTIPTGSSVPILAEPDNGYVFGGWTLTSGNGTIANVNAASTTFTMSTENTAITANFVATHAFTITPPVNGSVAVTDSQSQTVNSGASIGEGAVLNIVATPADGYRFVGWTATSGTLGDASAATTTFTMGTGDATITATFELIPEP